MAYEGYLIKVLGTTDYVIPMDKIIYESYKATYSVLDEDSKRSGTGRLKRTTYPHKVAHCKFTFRQMDNTTMYAILQALQ